MIVRDTSGVSALLRFGPIRARFFRWGRRFHWSAFQRGWKDFVRHCCCEVGGRREQFGRYISWHKNHLIIVSTQLTSVFRCETGSKSKLLRYSSRTRSQCFLCSIGSFSSISLRKLATLIIFCDLHSCYPSCGFYFCIYLIIILIIIKVSLVKKQTNILYGR